MKKYSKIIIGIIIFIVLCVIIFVGFLKFNYISKEEVEEAVVKDMGVDRSEIIFDSIDLEADKNYYDVDVFYQKEEFEFKVDAKSGKVIYTDYKFSEGANQTENNVVENTISLEDAKTIAVTNANLNISDVQFKKEKQDNDDGNLVYEIEFIYNSYEYDYEISQTGEIISFDKEHVYK